MESVPLFSICIAAFIAVFALLALLALVMRGLMAAFPEKPSGADPTMLAAIASATSAAYPGTKVTKVEERK